ncbi:hypothetical protein [Aneurinibacillus aneurinilyticus]|jgi:hypothetical protein|uniref:hypothetical protein n=1 Tax=Aneurinibacillus aneurinilyticus TaxID=1391 RepID=UPI0023F84D23|nr:hypothetical protein [Aneurinibacillus aneurinilyticus]MCI1695781.1 hypothetical protein [Aneurinibacillus aneurinilyticus]MED0672582.1 hypothetical protein [Aneurinibacillus aneurinilyticus]
MNAVQVRKPETKGILQALLCISILWSVIALAPKVADIMVTPSIEKSTEKKHSNVFKARINAAQAWAEQIKVNNK